MENINQWRYKQLLVMSWSSDKSDWGEDDERGGEGLWWRQTFSMNLENESPLGVLFWQRTEGQVHLGLYLSSSNLWPWLIETIITAMMNKKSIASSTGLVLERCCVLSSFSGVRLCNPIAYTHPRLEWVAMSSSRGSSQPRDWTHISYVSCIGRQVLYH